MFLFSHYAGPRLNGQVLAEFSRAQEMHQMSIEPSLRVKAATLWLYVQLLPSSVTATSSHHHHHRNKHPANPDPSHHRKPPTLYIFRVLPHGHRAHNTTDKVRRGMLRARRTLQFDGEKGKPSGPEDWRQKRGKTKPCVFSTFLWGIAS